MSKKITFGEFIESIAEETDRSKQFTHDFLKDFVSVINGGLEQDGKVNIAGFGKFKLSRVDERQGYNPQTEEKVTIPAHNKVIFKPYKDLREVVNAPYAHLEPELIEEEEDTEEDETVPTEEKSGQDDFIPTAPPTSNQAIDDEEDSGSDDETEEKNGNDDIVEFSGDKKSGSDEEVDNELNEFLGTVDAAQTDSESADEKGDQELSEEETDLEKDSTQESPLSKKRASRFSPDYEESSSVDSENEAPAPAIGTTQQEGKRVNSMPVFIAAVFILLILAGTAWYFSLYSGNNSNQTQMAAGEPTAVAQQEQQSTSQDQQNVSQQEQDQQDTPPQSQQTNQAQKQALNHSQQSNTRTTKDTKDQVNQTIKKGQTLWSLAEDNYGNPRLWPWIYGKNEALNNPDKILAGNSLSVPLPSGPQNSLNAADSVGVAKGFIATYQWYKSKSSSKAKNHLWGAKLYHDDIRNLADVKIDKSDLAYANQAR